MPSTSNLLFKSLRLSLLVGGALRDRLGQAGSVLARGSLALEPVRQMEELYASLAKALRGLQPHGP